MTERGECLQEDGAGEDGPGDPGGGLDQGEGESSVVGPQERPPDSGETGLDVRQSDRPDGDQERGHPEQQQRDQEYGAEPDGDASH